MTYSTNNLRPLLRNIGLSQTDIREVLPRNKYNNEQERILRVLSWLSAAEKSKTDDIRLMMALVAFNALYAVLSRFVKIEEMESDGAQKKRRVEDHELIDEFVEKIVNLDKQNILLHYLKEKRRDEVEKILASQYLFSSYWKSYVNYKRNMSDKRRISDIRWIKWHGERNEEVEKALAGDEILLPLKSVIHRVRVLRNQLLHGEAGYEDYYNRTQVKACAELMPSLVGCMLKIMMENYNISWGAVPYPPQGDKPDGAMYNFAPLPNKKKIK